MWCVKGLELKSQFFALCGKWIHKRCSGVKGSLESCKNFKYRKCLKVVASDEMSDSKALLVWNLLIHSVTLVIC